MTNETRLSGAVSDDAIHHLQIRSPLNRAIYAAIREYCCGNMADEDGYPYPLVDLTSNPAPADISTGEMEMITLADEIETAVQALTPAPEVSRMSGASKSGEALYIHFADNGNIRKWSREPFEGGVAYTPCA